MIFPNLITNFWYLYIYIYNSLHFLENNNDIELDIFSIDKVSFICSRIDLINNRIDILDSRER